MANIGRREFIAGIGALAVVRPVWSAGSDIRFGYAAITWGGNDRQAIEDIAAAGYRGIQLRASAVAEWGDKPSVLKQLLDRHGLTMVALSSGNLLIEPSAAREDREKHLRHARFLRDAGGTFLQLTDERPKRRAVTAADYRRMGQLLTELGKRTADIGVTVSYHNHMNNLGERPEEVRAVLEAADPRYVKLQLDTAHYQQGGGDPVKAIREYRDRLSFLHIKDLESPVPGATGDLSRSYRFVELGRGEVDLTGVFAALKEIGFRGWAVVELDRVPDDARTPKESALISRTYIEEQIGLAVGSASTSSGWTPLFDGATLAGWRGYKQPDASRTRWKVENGTLTLPPNDGKDTRGALDIITTSTFDRFELEFEFRISDGGNSGVKYFVLEDMDSAIGHEYQIIDDERHADAKIGPERQTAAFYDVMVASNRPIKAADQWNQGRIIVNDRTVEHWLNGTRVLRYELETPALKAAIDDSKFKGIARFGTLQKGHILLQDHGDAVWYRNIRIRRFGSAS